MQAFSRVAGVILATSTLALPAVAQTPAGTPPPATPTFDTTGVGDTSMFAPLTLPSPNIYRAGSGAPGPKYWQNRADYDLEATLDTATKTLRGELRLRYTNNSPDTLRFIWMQIEQNAFKDKSLNSFIFPQDSRFGARGFEGGDVDRALRPDRAAARAQTAREDARSNGTVMKVDLAEPLAPGQTATFDVAWHFLIPEHGADRMGRDGALYELAQWYPRVAVYDDVRGWNTEPYLGQGEFYLEYGDYTLDDHRSRGLHRRRARACCTNAAEVLTPTQIARLAQAAKSRHDGAHRHAGRAARAAPRARRQTGDADLELPREERARRAWAASPGLHVGRVELEGHHGVRPTTARARSRRGRTRPTCRACRSWSTRSAGSSIRGRRSAPSRARSAAWNTRWSRWRTRATTSTTCTTSSRTRSGTCGSR